MSLENCLDFFLFYSRRILGYWNSCKHHAKNITHPQRWVWGTDLSALYPWKQSCFFKNGNLRKQVEKLKKTFDVETLTKENFSENSPKENPTCAEEDEEKEEKEQAEEDFTIEVESEGEEKVQL